MRVPHQYNRDTDIITVVIENPLSNGVHFVETELVNYYGNHSLPSPQRFKVAPPAMALDLNAWTDTLPADGKSYVGISVTARDAEGMPIADDEPIHAQTSNGTLAETHQPSKNGSAQFYLYAPDAPGIATVEATYGDRRRSLAIRFADIDSAIVQGQVTDAAAGEPLQAVQLHTNSGLAAATDPKGHFFITTGSAFKNSIETTLHVSKVGYYPGTHEVHIEPNRATVIDTRLHPIADGVFTSVVFVLDSQTDLPATQQLLTTLEVILKFAGAKVHNIYVPGVKKSVEQRIKAVNAIAGRGYYLQINHKSWQEGQPAAVVAAHYRGNQGTETFLKRILEQVNKVLYETPIVTIQDRTTPEIQQTNKMAMTLEIRSLNHPNASVLREAHAIFFGAWTFLKGDGEIAAETQKRFMVYLKEMQAYSSN